MCVWCMGQIAQNKIKKKLKEEERRLEGRRQKRPGRRVTHLLHPENIRQLRTVKTSEYCQNIRVLSKLQSTVKTSEYCQNIREHQRTHSK